MHQSGATDQDPGARLMAKSIDAAHVGEKALTDVVNVIERRDHIVHHCMPKAPSPAGRNASVPEMSDLSQIQHIII